MYRLLVCCYDPEDDIFDSRIHSGANPFFSPFFATIVACATRHFMCAHPAVKQLMSRIKQSNLINSSSCCFSLFLPSFRLHGFCTVVQMADLV